MESPVIVHLSVLSVALYDINERYDGYPSGSMWSDNDSRTILIGAEAVGTPTAKSVVSAGYNFKAIMTMISPVAATTK